MANDSLKVFLDTEYTNFHAPGLISIGLVAETGEEAYFEVQYDASECSEFVRAVVVPLLGREPNAIVPHYRITALPPYWRHGWRSSDRAGKTSRSASTIKPIGICS